MIYLTGAHSVAIGLVARRLGLGLMIQPGTNQYRPNKLLSQVATAIEYIESHMSTGITQAPCHGIPPEEASRG